MSLGTWFRAFFAVIAGLFLVSTAASQTPSGSAAPAAEPASGAEPAAGTAAQPVAAPSAAPAQQPAGEASPPGYRELVDAAVDEFDRGNWTEAYGLFARAHALDPNARTLRGMGVCAFEAKRYVRATETLRAALSETRRPLDDAQRAEAQAIIARAEPFLARVALTVVPPEAVIKVDAQPPVFDEGHRLLLDPGMHQISARLPDREPLVRAVEVNSGDELQITLAFPSEPAEPAAASATPPSSPPPAERSVRPSVWAYVAGGAALVFAGSGIAFLALGNTGVKNVEETCPVGACTSDEIDRAIDDEHLQELQIGSSLSFALAGAAAITSVVLFVTGFGGEEQPPPAQLGVGPGGVVVRAAF